MNSFQIEVISREEYERFLPFVFSSSYEDFQQKDVYLLGATQNGVPCGALLARPSKDGKQMEIVSLFVGENFRRQGVASELLNGMEQLCRELELSPLNVSYAVSDEEAETMHAFFLRRGFAIPRKGLTMLSIPLASLTKTLFGSMPDPKPEMLRKIVPFSSLPSSALEDYRSRLGKDIPSYLDLSRAAGSLLPDLCLVYVESGKVVSFVVFTDREGMLHLNSAYLKHPSYGSALVALLKEAWRIQKKNYPEYDTMTVTAAVPAGERLLNKLLSGGDLSYRTAYYASKPVISFEGLPLPTGFGGVLSRTNILSEVLTEKGREVYQYMIPGELPAAGIQAWEGDDAPMIFLRYEPEGGESYTGFELAAFTELPVKDLPEEKVQKAVSEMNIHPGPAYARIRQGRPDQLFLSATVHEEPLFSEETSLDGFLNPFVEQVKDCRKILFEE